MFDFQAFFDALAGFFAQFFEIFLSFFARVTDL